MIATRRGWGPGKPGPIRPFCVYDYIRTVERIQVADYKGVLGDLRLKRAAIDRERERLDTAIAAIADLVSAEPPHQATQVEIPQVTPRAFSTLTMPQAIDKCLRLAEHPMTKRQIQDTLRAGGVRASKSFSAHIYNTLHRLSKDGGPIRREGDGAWGLSDWPKRGVSLRPSDAIDDNRVQ